MSQNVFGPRLKTNHLDTKLVWTQDEVQVGDFTRRRTQQDVATKPVTGPTLQKYCKAVRLMFTSTNMATLHYLRNSKTWFYVRKGLSQGSEQSRTQGAEEVWKDGEQDLSQTTQESHTTNLTRSPSDGPCNRA